MKKKSESTAPILLVVPSVIQEKMRAIEALANASYEIAKALNSVSVDVTIENCTIENCENGIQLANLK